MFGLLYTKGSFKSSTFDDSLYYIFLSSVDLLTATSTDTWVAYIFERNDELSLWFTRYVPSFILPATFLLFLLQ